MKILKRLTVGMLFSAMALGMVGCSGGKKAAGDLTEVRMWTNKSHSQKVMQKLVDDWNETTGKEKGIKFVYEVREGDSDKDVEIAMAAGNAPEIFTTSNRALAMDGKLLALDDVEGGQEIIDKYGSAFTKGWKINGKVYSIPFSTSTRGLIYNKDMFKEAGLVDENGEPTPPKTLNELVEYAKKLTDKDNNKYGIVFPLKWGTWFASDISSPAFSSTGNEGYDPVTGKYDYSGFKPMMEAIMQIKKDGSYYPGAEGLDNDPARARFAEGNIGMKFGFSFDVGVLNDQFPAKCDWGVAEYPVVDVNNKYKQILSVNDGTVINKETAEKTGIDKVMEVYKFYHSDEVMTALYQNGLELPVFPEQILDHKLLVNAKGWEDFGKMVEISVAKPLTMPTETSGKESLANLFINKVWTGERTIDSVLKEYTDTMNEGIEKYKEIHPDEDMNQYIDKSWNVHR